MASRRVLIVAYHYPPEPASGALRMSYLARYLPEFGWKPVVLTRNAPALASNDDVIRVGKAFAAYTNGRSRSPSNSRALARIKSAVKSVVFFPDGAASWIPRAFSAAVRAHRKEPFDAIITSAMPASVH
ncbi:MAG TPA: hypothetical protein VMD07_03950, partial [Candidatus Acidoferrales bacterium]|nr:hypothetical protein [Candidatus Acidoferrales bacterium]